jgi:hypothetical protein
LEKLPAIPEPTDKESYSSFSGRGRAGSAASEVAGRREPQSGGVSIVAPSVDNSTGPTLINILGNTSVEASSTNQNIINLFDTNTADPNANANPSSNTAGMNSYP